MFLLFRRSLLLFLPLAGLTLASAEAVAKSIPMGTLSRSLVRDECLRAGGRPFGIADETAAYGCSARYAVVSCTPETDCRAVVRDTIPVPGNSLRAIFNLDQPGTSSRAVQPVDARVNSTVTP
jgi:hypothetical protein